MTYKELLESNTWQNISSKFLHIYPEGKKDLEGYKKVFEILKGLEPERMDMSIVVAKERDGDYEYLEVSGLHNNPKNKEEMYLQGIELTPWRYWLGMDICNESLSNFSELEIIVHCLYEMTFFGFTEEDIQKRINRIENSREED